MKDLQIIFFEGLTFQYVEGCGLALVKENGDHAETESFKETEIRKNLEDILDRIEWDNDIETVNCGTSGQYYGTMIQVLEDGEEIAEYVLKYMEE